MAAFFKAAVLKFLVSFMLLEIIEDAIWAFVYMSYTHMHWLLEIKNEKFLNVYVFIH